jgi:hypothetical protein
MGLFWYTKEVSVIKEVAIISASSPNNPEYHLKRKIPHYRYAEYYKKGWRWCRVCDIWFRPEENAIFCKECKKLTRRTIKNKKKDRQNPHSKQPKDGT